MDGRRTTGITRYICELTSRIIALANASVIVAAVDSELQAREDKPDTIFVVETELSSTCYLSIAKEKGDSSAEVREGGPIEITLQAGEPAATGDV